MAELGKSTGLDQPLRPRRSLLYSSLLIILLPLVFREHNRFLV